jgi:alpha-amylase
MTTGSRATLSFTGTAATWIAYRDRWSGIAKVYVDGVLKGEIDTFASPDAAQYKAYTVTGLSDGAHTLAIEPAGRRNPSSGGNWVWVDAFEVTAGGSSATSSPPLASSSEPPATTQPPSSTAPTAPTGTLYRVEQNNARMVFTGTWNNNSMGSHSGSSAKLSMSAGSKATLSFTGNAATWIAYRDQWSGIAKIYIDGVLKGEIDSYAPTGAAKSVMYSATGLPWGNHTITIEATGRKAANSGGAWIWIDAIDYVGSN